MRPAAIGAAAGLLGAVVLAGCSSEGGTPQLRDSADRGYVVGDGTVALVPPAERDDPVAVAGTTLAGDALDVADLRGQAVVLNVWWSDCPPCRAEAPDLVSAHDALSGRDVTFVGINIRDVSTTNAQRYEDTFGIPYDSLYDPYGQQLLNLRGDIPPNAVPSTLVLDRQGAVAARIIGEVEAATLTGLVEDVLAESATGA